MIEIVRELPVTPTGAEQVLVKKGEDYFVVSSVEAPVSGFETLVFPANAEGEITDWCQVAGGHGMVREEAIADLANWSGEDEDAAWRALDASDVLGYLGDVAVLGRP